MLHFTSIQSAYDHINVSIGEVRQETMLEELGCSEDVFLKAKHAREFEALMIAHGNAGHELDRITAAAYVYMLALLSRAADMDTFDRMRMTNSARLDSYFKRIGLLDRFYPTLKDVEVTHADCRYLLDLYRGKKDAFAYIDPPYTPDKMFMKDHYGDNSWSIVDHQTLVDKLLVTEMKVALSGYDTASYERLITAGWTKLYLKNVHVSSAATGRRSDEYLYINFNLPSSLEDRISQFNYSAY
jgi:site-specific DNA-adenine methylase